MKLAVTYENGQVFQHFGHTENFKLYSIEDGKITDSQVVNTNGQGHGALGRLPEGAWRQRTDLRRHWRRRKNRTVQRRY